MMAMTTNSSIKVKATRRRRADREPRRIGLGWFMVWSARSLSLALGRVKPGSVGTAVTERRAVALALLFLTQRRGDAEAQRDLNPVAASHRTMTDAEGADGLCCLCASTPKMRSTGLRPGTRAGRNRAGSEIGAPSAASSPVENFRFLETASNRPRMLTARTHHQKLGQPSVRTFIL